MERVIVTYHVRYKPAIIDEWWDWKKYPTEEEAISAFISYPPRRENTRDHQLIRTETVYTETTRLLNL